MKIKYLLSFLLLFTALPSLYSQNHKPQEHYGISYEPYLNRQRTKMVFGLGAGAVFPIMSVRGGDVDMSSKAGYKLGMMFGVDFGGIEIVPELWYSGCGMSVKVGDDPKLDISNRSLDMPIMVGIRLAKPLRLNLGPTFALMCNNKVTEEDGSETEFGSVKSSVGYVIGFSYDIVSGLFLDFRYGGRFAARSNEWSKEPFDVWTYTLDLTAGFRF